MTNGEVATLIYAVVIALAIYKWWRGPRPANWWGKDWL